MEIFKFVDNYTNIEPRRENLDVPEIYTDGGAILCCTLQPVTRWSHVQLINAELTSLRIIDSSADCNVCLEREGDLSELEGTFWKAGTDILLKRVSEASPLFLDQLF